MNMKNFLLFLLGILVNALYMYVLFPIFFVGITACLWVPIFFESSFSFLIGIVITILTPCVVTVVEHKLESD